jgi:hypothetical protein
MTRAEAQLLWPIIQAWSESKTIQFKVDEADSWRDLADPEPEWNGCLQYRIKPIDE